MRLTRTPDGPRWLVERDVDAPAETVWAILTDTTRWAEWAPVVTAVESSTRRIEPGTTGRMRFQGVAVPVPFEVREVDEASYRWTLEFAHLFSSGHRVEARGDGSRVGFELPPVAAGYAPVVSRACANIADLAES